MGVDVLGVDVMEVDILPLFLTETRWLIQRLPPYPNLHCLASSF